MLSLYIRNITGKPISDYEYVVMVNAEKIASGKILKHRRSDGWAKLVRRIADLNAVELFSKR
jgi:hypothetical protein